MRKRAQQRFKSRTEIPKHVVIQKQPKIQTKPDRIKRNYWIAISLIGVFLLVLFFNAYFNITSGISINPEGDNLTQYYLSGPDPYYNMRLVETTYQTGSYPYYSETDPLLNYPLGASGGRAPLFNMLAIGFSRILTPFMNEIDAIGYSMQFIPALFGALLIFPVYFIGKELFNRKAAIIGALFIALIPIHLSSGHGSAYALFDHDSFNLLLFFLTFYFLIKSIKEKNISKSILFAILSGVPLAALSMTWVEAQYLYVVIAIYAFVQMFIDIFTNKIDRSVLLTSSIVLFSGYLISLPVTGSRGNIIDLNTELFLCIAVTAFGVAYYIFGKRKIPWTVSLPTIFSIGAVGLIFLYFIEDLSKTFNFLSPLKRFSTVLFGTGIYGDKVSLTIAEANTYQISHTVMSFGPSIYWLAWGGIVFLIWQYYKNKVRRDYLFIIILFIINIWLAGTAGRFLNDMVPLIAVLGGLAVWLFVDWLDYKQMIRNIKSAGGGLHGMRRGIKFLHIFGILFIGFLVILPNVFIAFDAAVPNTGKLKDDGENWTTLKGYMYDDDSYRGAFGVGVVKEKYWTNALDWLCEQDTDIEDHTQRPAFISWWDYGFYEVALGGHPTVADNFQDGIPPAANFHTATSEEEAIAVWIVRLIEGNRHFNGKLTDEVVDLLTHYMGEKNANNIAKWMNEGVSPSTGKPIGAEYDEEVSKKYTEGQQYAINPVYHDIVGLLLNQSFDEEANRTIGLSDEEITWLYHDLQELTGWSIRYYGVEGYDKQIFNIFGFLSDKSVLMINGIGDDFIDIKYKGYEIDSNTREKISGDLVWDAEEVINWEPEDRRNKVITNTIQEYKDAYFETMFYRTYIGPYDVNEDGSKTEYSYQIPCVNMKHFYAEYFSDLSKYAYYDTGKAAVVIAKYYEGAYVNGTVTFLEGPVDAQLIFKKNVRYYPEYTGAVDHDKTNTDENGNFSLIAGAGAFLDIQRNYGEEIRPFSILNITFDGENGTETAPITDEDAMRKGGNYERILNITIEPATTQGYFYVDNDYDRTYNTSVDTPLQNINISIWDIADIRVPSAMAVTDESGFYNVTGLLPGFYYVRAEQNGFVIGEQLVELYQFKNYYNISQLAYSAVKGKVYYEDEDNIIPAATVNLTYKRMDLQGNVEEKLFIDTAVTDSNGEYEFTKTLIPGEYNLSVLSQDNYYVAEEEILLQANETLYHNISLYLKPVTVSGALTYNGVGVENILVSFIPNPPENNTAEEDSINSDENGDYEIDLTPGNYSVIVNHQEQSTLIYDYEGTLEVKMGEDSISLDIPLNKYSSTVSGLATYDGEGISDLELDFRPDAAATNNTALAFKVTSDENGAYLAELVPGQYKIEVESEEFVEEGQNYSYTFTGTFTVTDNEIINGKIYNIPLAKTEK